MNKNKLPFLTEKFLLFLILFITFLSYIGIVNNEFVWDDTTFIVKWPIIRKINLPLYFKGILPADHEGVYRPLRTFLYAVSYSMYKTNPVLYHFQSIVLHLTVIFLVFLFIKKLTGHKYLALTASFLFGVHPVQTEAVAFITASFDLFTVIFYFLTLILFINFLNKQHIVWLIFSLITCVLAFLSGEMSLTLPFILVLIWSYKRQIGKLYYSFRPLLLYFTFLIIYLYVRFIILQISVRGDTDNIYKIIMLWVYMLRGLLRYVTVLFFPLILSVSYTVYNRGQKIEPDKVNFWLTYLFDIRVITALLVVIGSIILYIKLQKKYPLISFSIAWFYITLFPVSNIIPTTSGVAERYLTIPLVSWCLIISFVIISSYKFLTQEYPKIWTTKLIMAGFVLYALFFITRTFLRTSDWKNALTLWNRTVVDTPNSSLAYNNLGYEYLKTGNHVRAIYYFRQAVAITPGNYLAYYNLGLTNLLQKRYDDAIDEFNKSLFIQPDYYQAANYLAYAHILKDNSNTAMIFLQDYAKKYPNSDSFITIGMLYLQMDKLDEAIPAFKSAIALNPMNMTSYNNLAVTYLVKGERDQAVAILQSALKIFPDNPALLSNLNKAQTLSKDSSYTRDMLEEASKVNVEINKDENIPE